MVLVMANVLRKRKHDALRRSWAITLLIDDKGPFRLFEFKCDGGPPDGVSSGGGRRFHAWWRVPR
eukprot:8905873-Lingulodinium_polyedra.AAC.1